MLEHVARRPSVHANTDANHHAGIRTPARGQLTLRLSWDVRFSPACAGCTARARCRDAVRGGRPTRASFFTCFDEPAFKRRGLSLRA